MFFNATSHKENKHPSPPYYGRGVATDSGRQWARVWEKKHGHPADENVAALVRVLEGLKPSVEQILGGPGSLRYGLMVVPELPAMYNEDLFDAAQYVGFVPVIPRHPAGDINHVPENEMGAVRQFPNIPWNGPDGSTNEFVVSLTSAALTAHVDPGIPVGGWAQGQVHCELGLTEANPDGIYWDAVSLAINEAMNSYSWRAAELNAVILHGEHAHNTELQRIVRREVLARQIDGTMPAVYDREPLMAGALGAAKMAMECWKAKNGTFTFACFPDLHPSMQGW